MDKTVIKNSELEERRSICEMHDFIERVFLRVKHVYYTQQIKFQSLYGNYKQFIEEYLPAFKYLKYVYGLSNNIFYRHFGTGNQSYDGEIEINNNKLKIEIGCPKLGKEAYLRSMELIERGSSIHLYGSEYFQKIRDIILQTANKKAKIEYGDTLLIIYYAFVEQLYPGDIGLKEEDFENLINELKSISYKAERVDFFVPSFKFENYIGVQTKPERLYRIK